MKRRKSYLFFLTTGFSFFYILYLLSVVFTPYFFSFFSFFLDGFSVYVILYPFRRQRLPFFLSMTSGPLVLFLFSFSSLSLPSSLYLYLFSSPLVYITLPYPILDLPTHPPNAPRLRSIYPPPSDPPRVVYPDFSPSVCVYFYSYFYLYSFTCLYLYLSLNLPCTLHRYLFALTHVLVYFICRIVLPVI